MKTSFQKLKSKSFQFYHKGLNRRTDDPVNSFNLADDLIEPWRAMVDQMAYFQIGNEVRLNSKQRKNLAGILHFNCKIDGKIMCISTGIELYVDSLKATIMEKKSEFLKIPVLIDFKDCVLFQERIDYQEEKVGIKDLVVL